MPEEERISSALNKTQQSVVDRAIRSGVGALEGIGGLIVLAAAAEMLLSKSTQGTSADWAIMGSLSWLHSKALKAYLKSREH